MTRNLTLGELIGKLEKFPTATPCRYDFNVVGPDGIDSYRGYYDELALGCGRQGVTAGEVLVTCRSAVGREFHGYKGGTFLMTEATPVWVANWGECDGTAVVDVVRDAEFVVIVTRKVR